MLLSDWRGIESHAAALTPKVVAAVEPVLTGLGAEADPDCWIVWGDDPSRFTVLAPTPAGLVNVHVRVTVPQEGPRAGGKLIRWNHVQIGDFSVETQAGHRLLGFQLEGQLLRAVDLEVDRLSEFVLALLAVMDGRSPSAR
jgi:hypothetical protein